MSKRRRASSIASRGHEEDSMDSLEASSSSGPTMRKRSKKMDPIELCQQLYDMIRSHKKDDGSLLCDSFIRVPKRRQEPGYYEVVSNPIDLLKVQQKFKTDEYEDIDDLQQDIELIVSNTKAFYKKSSQEYKDAVELWDLFLTIKNRLLNIKDETPEPERRPRGRPSRSRKAQHIEKMDLDHSESTSESSITPDEEVSVYEELFTAVMTATDSDNKPLHTVFQLLPSRKKYPEYYDHIDNPMDLRMVAQKIQNNEYGNLTELEKDLLLVTSNACSFNEPGSQIYKTAKLLKKVIQSKKIEVEHSKSNSGKVSERIRNKRLRGSTCLSAVTAALRDEESESEVEGDDQDDDEGSIDFDDLENPQWVLFDTVKSVTGNTGAPISEPFWRLPNRRYHPDYYKEIKNPVSLMQIRRKLINRNYGTLSELAGDMNIMFENAKKYNQANSKLYKDAVKLQKLMQTKVEELLDLNQDTDSEESELGGTKRRSIKPKTPITTPVRPGRPPKEVVSLKKRLHNIAKQVFEYTCVDGRRLMMGFHEKPSRKVYSDYYDVIQEPIDYLEIEAKIKGEQYASELDLIKDFKLMFANCRQYNEENSPIYEDSITLEKFLLDKVAPHIVQSTPEKPKNPLRIARPRKHNPPANKNLKTMYEAIRDYREPKANRQLALIFMKLPSKSDYPDYFEVIKNPIDMEKIAQKLKMNIYETVDDIANDFIIMFDNACKFNEPDSQIYKDALVLQRVCLQTKLQLKEDDESVPDVPAAVSDILLTLFTTVYNHQDIEERCYSDSMADLPEHDDVDGKKVRALSLDLIKRRLDKGAYKRLDTFQDDFFACLDRARRLTRTDSQVFEDSIELQACFIRQRDELCRNGELLQSPAINFTLHDMNSSIEAIRQSKMLQESLEEETETRSSDDSIIKESNINMGEAMTCNQQVFKVGEFVYLDAKEKGCEPHILMIERLWNNNGQQMLYGNYYLRPAETYHLTTRKFLEKEVFKSDTHVAVPLEEVKERCCVVNVKHYFTMKPEGYEEKDIYVCESRYSSRIRTFKKIKMYPENPDLKLVQREVPLEPKRVVSVFRERVEKHKDELAELQEQEKLAEKEKPNVPSYSHMDSNDGNTYYEQYNTICSGVVKTGDYVYVAADGGRQTIAQVEAIWDTKDGKCYFRGPWFVTPSEITQPPSKIFYKQEVFLSSVEDTNPLVSIVGKCAVLEYNDYISSRPTEIPESDVYICSSMYDEVNRQVKKLPIEGLKKFTHNSAVTEDEIYYFPRLINPPKVSSGMAQPMAEPAKPHNPVVMEVETSLPTLTKMTDMDMLMDDSMDGGPPSVGSGDILPIISTPGTSVSTVATPVTARKKPKNKIVTGYILYSREYRKQIVQNNPESNFGEISRIVGVEWRSLPAHEKQVWEEKASKLNEESKAQCALDEQNQSNMAPSPAPPPPPPPNPDTVYECLWDTCDYQFEDIPDLIDHCIKDSKDSQGHVQSYFAQTQEGEINCHWRTCQRTNKKNCQPFPNVSRLVRHVRDMHINKGNGKIIAPADRSKNYKSSTKPAAANRPSPATQNAPAATPTPQKQPDPIFISVPPRPQRVLHSEAYIKYIEGLQVDNKYISPWEKTLQATQETAPAPDPEKLNTVSAWLGTKADQQDNVLTALWTLRNQLLKDTLGLHKTY